jgi:hypothetical protein
MSKENSLRLQATAKFFWVEWTLATVVGYTLAILGILPWVVRLAYTAQPELVSGLAGGAVLGGALGSAQWLVLRRHAREVTGWWLLASIAGGLLGLALGMALADTIALPSLTATTREAAMRASAWRVALQTGVTGAVLGVVLGGAQWLVLRRSLRPAGWWILVNGLGWMAGMALGAVLAAPASVIGALLITSITSGAISGLPLQGWVQQAQ